MKKSIKVFLGLFVLTGLGFFLIFSGFRAASKSEIVSLRKAPVELKQTLFLNDFFVHFHGISMREALPLKKFHADLQTLRVIKGRVTDTENFTVTGREIVFAFWDLSGIINARMDHVALNFRTIAGCFLRSSGFPNLPGFFKRL